MGDFSFLQVRYLFLLNFGGKLKICRKCDDLEFGFELTDTHSGKGKKVSYLSMGSQTVLDGRMSDLCSRRAPSSALGPGGRSDAGFGTGKGSDAAELGRGES